MNMKNSIVYGSRITMNLNIRKYIYNKKIEKNIIMKIIIIKEYIPK